MPTAAEREALKDYERGVVKELREATDLEHLNEIFKVKGSITSFEISQVFFERMEILMRERIASIKTPEDVLAVHNYFKSLGIYHHKTQKELGERAKEVIGSWDPESRRARGRARWISV
jgi:hypothetical protein